MLITPESFARQYLEGDVELVFEGIKLGAIPIEDGLIPVHKTQEHWENWLRTQNERRTLPIRREIEGKVGALHRTPGMFASPEGKAAFEKNISNIHIKGEDLSSHSSPEWWEREGFASEAGAIAFQKAMERGVVRIFNKKVRSERR